MLAEDEPSYTPGVLRETLFPGVGTLYQAEATTMHARLGEDGFAAASFMTAMSGWGIGASFHDRSEKS